MTCDQASELIQVLAELRDALRDQTAALKGSLDVIAAHLSTIEDQLYNGPGAA